MQLLYSSRTRDDLVGRGVLGTGTTVTLTRTAPPGWTGGTGRIDAAMLARRTIPPAGRPRIFVCGPTVFAETTGTLLVDLGHDPSSIRIERFGNSGEPS